MAGKDYTVETYRVDKRCKRGEKLIDKTDFINENFENLKNDFKAKGKLRYEIHETWVTKRNMMSGKEFQERYDTPHFCSPSSETYWCT